MAGLFKKWLSKLTETPEETKEESIMDNGGEAVPSEADTDLGDGPSQTDAEPEEIPSGEDTLFEAISQTIPSSPQDPKSEAELESPVSMEAQLETPEDHQVEILEEVQIETPEDVQAEETEETLVMVQQETQSMPAAEKTGFFERLKAGLSKTSKAITDRIDLLLNDYGKIDEELYEELEEILITADIGMETTLTLIDHLKKALVERRISEAAQVKSVLRDVMIETLKAHSDNHLNLDQSPAILFVIGVNGAGKTTTIGKIAHKLKAEGKTVMLAAADTFRAAAIDQLKIWGERSGVPVIAHQEGSDPAAVVYDAIQAAKARKIDVLICDTAGRLHNKKNLMNELAKIFRVIERDFPEAQREVLLVLDATTGQNGLQQAKIFKETAAITGIALTKLDGTAKGGVVLSILHEVEIPVKLIGVGEGLNDLQPFDPEKFVNALLDLS